MVKLLYKESLKKAKLFDENPGLKCLFPLFERDLKDNITKELTNKLMDSNNSSNLRFYKPHNNWKNIVKSEFRKEKIVRNI